MTDNPTRQDFLWVMWDLADEIVDCPNISAGDWLRIYNENHPDDLLSEDEFRTLTLALLGTGYVLGESLTTGEQLRSLIESRPTLDTVAAKISDAGEHALKRWHDRDAGN